MNTSKNKLHVLTLGRRNAKMMVRILQHLDGFVMPEYERNLQAAIDRMEDHHRGVRFVVNTAAIVVLRQTMGNMLIEIPHSTYESLNLAFRTASTHVENFSKEIADDNAP
jgi:hypothetical protein